MLMNEIIVKAAASSAVECLDPAEFFRQFSALSYSVLLTGNGPEDVSDYSIIAIVPHTIVSFHGGSFTVENESGARALTCEFWGFLSKVFHSLRNNVNYEYIDLCGWIGYMSFNAYSTIEKIECGTEESYSAPLFQAVLYNTYFIFDHAAGKAVRIDIEYLEKSRMEIRIPPEKSGYSISDLQAEGSMEEYCAKINKILEYIISGDVYEACLSRQYTAEFEGDPYALFQAVYSGNPAPYSAYLNYPGTAVVCNSPELFLRCRGINVETRPIKGTAPRDADPDKDRKNMEALLNSAKDHAELNMIIDLMRNDLGKVCAAGSIKVSDAGRLEKYENVYHLIGIVTGELTRENNYVDLLKAVFPGGSITGCPKIRSIEIIEELETYSRNLYTGTIFLMTEKYFTANIIIRTAVITGGKIFLNSGGAVTIDSDPLDEYMEIGHKMENFFRLMNSGRDEDRF
jgi:para-aminobenzoate synthetase component 1